MSSPIPDAPAPSATDGSDVGFAPGPPVASLCGFKIPSFLLILKWRLPPLGIPIPPPIPKISIGINCSLSNPLDVSASIPPGGGRTSKVDRDPDDDYDDLNEAA